MKAFTTVISCLLFAIFGSIIADMSKEQRVNSYNTLNAATLPNWSASATKGEKAVLPQFLLWDFEDKAVSESEPTSDFTENILIDSLYKRTVALENERQVVKVKWRKVPVPGPVVRDTIRVPTYYLATQVGNKEGPTGECISVYEVHKVDEICSGITNSSDGAIEYHVDVGE